MTEMFYRLALPWGSSAVCMHDDVGDVQCAEVSRVWFSFLLTRWGDRIFYRLHTCTQEKSANFSKQGFLMKPELDWCRWSPQGCWAPPGHTQDTPPASCLQLPIHQIDQPPWRCLVAQQHWGLQQRWAQLWGWQRCCTPRCQTGQQDL